MSGARIGSQGANSIGWENEGKVLQGYAQRVREAYEQQRANGTAKLSPLTEAELTTLKAQLKSRTSNPSDLSITIGDDKQLIQRSGKVYLRDGENYSMVAGFQFPPKPMASPKRAS